MMYVKQTIPTTGKNDYVGVIDYEGIRFEIPADTEEELNEKAHQFYMERDKQYQLDALDTLEKGLGIEYLTTTEHCLGMTSLVGVGGKAPFSYGNYWQIVIGGEMYPVVNMWAENYKVMRDKISNFIFVNGVCFINEPSIDEAYYIKDAPFLKYNLHRGMSFTEKKMITDWYKDLK